MSQETPSSPPPPSYTDLLGSKLLTKTNGKQTTKPTAKALEGKELIVLYFSANWCPPCKQFTPLLIDFYETLCASQDSKKQNLEIVFVSSDQTLEDFNTYYGKMPWTAIPTVTGSAAIKQALATKLSIRSIPTVVVMTGDGKFVSDQGRNDVLQVMNKKYTNNDEKLKALEGLVQEWKDRPAVPLNEAQLGGAMGGPFGMLYQAFMYILKNPTYLIGILYIIKMIMRKLKSEQDGGMIEDEEDDVVDSGDNEDHEF